MLARKMCITMLAAVIMSLFFVQYVAAAPNVRVFFNGNEIYYDVPPQIIADRTMVPIAATVRAITGNEVAWDNATRTITFDSFGHHILHRIGETIVYVDGVPVQFPTPSLIVDGRTLVPIQMIARTADCNVVWDGDNRYVIITRTIAPVAPPIAPAPPTPPVTPVHPIATIVTINSVDADKTAINAGEAITLTVQTNAGASDVWIHYDNTDLYATGYTTNAAGNRVWTLRFYPTKSQTVTVYANTDRTLTGAIQQQSKRITVDTQEVTIYGVDTDKTTINYGDSVYLTVRTSGNATAVRGEDGSRTIQFTYRSTNANGQKTWTATYSPQDTTKVWVYARKDTGSETSDSIRLYVERNVTPVIYSVTTNPGYVIGADPLDNDFVVTTNTVVNSVYVEAGGRRYYAEPNPRTQGGNLVWYINGVPLQTAIAPPGGSFNVNVVAATQGGQTTNQNTSITARPPGVTPLTTQTGPS